MVFGDQPSAGSELVINCNHLKLPATHGKKYLTDVATAETLLRLVQSVPSEPIKLWLAKVGFERMQKMADPARSLNRARETWQKHGRSEKGIQQRMTGQEPRFCSKSTRSMKACKRAVRRITTLISAESTEIILADAENIGHYIRITSGD